MSPEQMMGADLKLQQMDPKRREILKSLLLQNMRGRPPMPMQGQRQNPMMAPAAPPPAMQGWVGPRG